MGETKTPGTKPGYIVRGRVWVDKGGELYIGGGRARLLERIPPSDTV